MSQQLLQGQKVLMNTARVRPGCGYCSVVISHTHLGGDTCSCTIAQVRTSTEQNVVNYLSGANALPNPVTHAFSEFH